MDAGGDLHIIELKHDCTIRDVIAQALNYASWDRTLTYDGLTEIYSNFDADRELEEGEDKRQHGSFLVPRQQQLIKLSYSIGE